MKNSLVSRTQTKLIDQKVRTRVPSDTKWYKQKVITARDAIVACSICRNQVTRGLSDLSDQFEGIERIGESIVEASIVIVRGPAVQPLAPVRVEVPNGLGGSMQATIGVNSLILSESDLGATVDELANMAPSNFLRKLSDQFRAKTSDCCKQQVWDRVLGQSKQRRTIKVKSRRTRELLTSSKIINSLKP